MTPILYPYKIASATARALSRTLNTRRVREAGTYRPRRSHVIINRGNPRVPRWANANLRWINTPIAVERASNKLEAFKAFTEHGVQCPEYTTDVGIAREWVSTGAVVARSLLRASGGKGIHLYAAGEAIPEPNTTHEKLWVKYVKKAAEYRLHVFEGRVIRIQEKRRERGTQDTRNNQIRNRENGWVFCTEEVNLPDGLSDLAIRAVASLGLHFGAVDIIWNQRQEQGYVLEVNCCPGLEGTSLDVYTQAIKEVTG